MSSKAPVILRHLCLGDIQAAYLLLVCKAGRVGGACLLLPAVQIMLMAWNSTKPLSFHVAVSKHGR